MHRERERNCVFRDDDAHTLPARPEHSLESSQQRAWAPNTQAVINLLQKPLSSSPGTMAALKVTVTTKVQGFPHADPSSLSHTTP